MMKKLKVKKTIWFLPLVFASQISFGQLLKVNQTVFGMDCATCAHGVQEGLVKMNGVQAASISLNSGEVSITLNPLNHITLLEIRKDIINSGFSPRDADVKMKGTLQRTNKELALQVQNEVFWVSQHSAASVLSRLKNLPAGTEVTLEGSVKDMTSAKYPPVWNLAAEKIW